jgi:hypothetical protein
MTDAMLNVLTVGSAIPAAWLDRPISGVRLEGRTLREELDTPRLCVFLRHFG